MTRKIKKVAIIGSGIMGSGIACHMANVGCEVLLLDIVPKGAEDSDKKSERNASSCRDASSALPPRSRSDQLQDMFQCKSFPAEVRQCAPTPFGCRRCPDSRRAHDQNGMR